jgi:hypothetical protein
MQSQKLQTKELLMTDIADAWCLQRHSRKGEGIIMINITHVSSRILLIEPMDHLRNMSVSQLILKLEKRSPVSGGEAKAGGV